MKQKGKWIKHTNKEGEFTELECSICHTSLFDTSGKGTNYCSTCGADMVEEIIEIEYIPFEKRQFYSFHAAGNCKCGQKLAENWLYCPTCGTRFIIK